MSKKSKKNIGLLISRISTIISTEVWNGVYTAVRNAGANLITYVGDALADNKDTILPANIIFNFVKENRLDGLVVWGGALGQFISVEQLAEFCNQYKPIPVVNISIAVPGITSITINNYKGMYSLVKHFIEHHGYREVAFIKGPEGHPEAEERFKAYQDALKEHNIPFRSDLIAPGEFDVYSGRKGVELFLDTRQLKPEAIICVDDDTAVGVMEALQKRKINIPGEIALGGFDNVEDAEAMTPALTTVRQPLDKLGQMAGEKLFDILEGRSVDREYNIPTEVMFRESCGCLDRDVENTGNIELDSAIVTTGSQLKQRKDDIVKSILESLGDECSMTDIDSKMDIMVDALINELDHSSSFLQTLNSIITQEFQNETPLSNLQKIISKMRTAITPYLSYKDLVVIESKFHQTRVLIGKAIAKRELYDKLTDRKKFRDLSYINQQMNLTFDFPQLKEVVENDFPQAGITSCFLVIYKDKNTPQEAGKLLFGIDQGHKIDLPAEGMDFSPYDLLPDSVFPKGRELSLIVEPLYFGDDIIGYVVLETEAHMVDVCDNLRWQLSSVLKRLQVTKEHQIYEEELKTQNSHIIDLVTPMIESIQEVSRVSLENRDNIEKLALMTQEGAKKIENTNTIVEDISSNANEILKMIKIIDDISESVNVLAINAAIQSSHAGSYGKAFSVIAKEIRRLAVSTAENARDISHNLNSVIQKIRESRQASQENLESFMEIEKGVTAFKGSLKIISNQMTDLSSNSNSILTLMERGSKSL